MRDLLRARAEEVETDAAIRNDAFKGYTDAMKAYYRFLTEKKTADIAEKILFERLNKDALQARLIEALILSGGDTARIEEVFRIPRKATLWYRELFFDTAAFLTDLDLISYLEECGEDKELKMRAVDFGFEYILYTYGHVTPNDAERAHLLQNICASTAYKALSMNFHAMTSSAGKQAAEYAKVMVKAFETLQRIPQDTGLTGDLIQYLTREPGAETADANIASEDIC